MYVYASLEPRLSVPDFVSQHFSPKLRDKIRNRKAGFEATYMLSWCTMLQSTGVQWMSLSTLLGAWEQSHLGVRGTTRCYQPSTPKCCGHFVMAFANKTDACVHADSTQTVYKLNKGTKLIIWTMSAIYCLLSLWVVGSCRNCKIIVYTSFAWCTE